MQDNLVNPKSDNAQVAIEKIPNSIARRIPPGTAIGALPDRLGSSGTANIPQMAAAIIGKARTNTNRSQVSLRFQPHIPIAKRAASSRRNRMARLIGFEPMRFFGKERYLVSAPSESLVWILVLVGR